MRTLDLSSGRWTARAIGNLAAVPASVRGERIPAAVPGCIHTDLIRAKLIGDPSVGFNELDIQWIGRTDWEYRLSFDLAEDMLAEERADLVFDGLDTIAHILVNGEPAGQAANMFHPHRFDVKRLLRVGANELTVRFRAPLEYIREMEAKLGPRPVNGDWDPFNFMRKAACNFGWDWGPKVATVGIWKPVRLEAWSVARLASVRPLVTRDDQSNWVVSVCCDVEHAVPEQMRPIRLAAALFEPLPVGLESETTHAPRPSPWVTGRTASVRSTRISLNLLVASPILWQARNRTLSQSGENFLYFLSVYLMNATDKTPVDVTGTPIGFRTIELDTSTDANGSGFTLRVNGKPVFCVGANWIPEGLWPGQVPKATYRERIRQACGAGMNMLRVWGGGYYEDEEFYRECDRQGILVWQDFMFSCAMYPEEPPYPALVEAEARHQIARLSSHPSVALWCGGNECIWGFESWGWKERLSPGQTWGRGYYLDLLPRLVSELDSTRPYWPNSPWSDDDKIHPNDGRHGDRHTWDVRMEAYHTVPCRFLSEAGHQSPSCYSTLAAALPPGELALGSRALEHRQRGPGGNAKQYDEVLNAMFRPARSFDEWHAQAQLAQARAVGFAIDSALAQYPRCSGVLIWQLNDAWPGLSWSLIDSAGKPKPALSALLTSYRPFFHPVADRLAVSLAALDAHAVPLELGICRVGIDGSILQDHRIKANRQPMGVELMGYPEDLVGPIRNPTTEFYLATVYHSSVAIKRRAWFLAPDKDIALPRPVIKVHGELLESLPDFPVTRSVVLTAGTLIKDAVLSCDRLPRRQEFGARGPIMLLPGEELRVFYEHDQVGSSRADAAALVHPPHLWCANHFSLGT